MAVKDNDGQALGKSRARLLTIPNLLCAFRIALTPFVAWLLIEGRFEPALWIFVIAGISDGFDGFLARSLKQTSRLGVYLDPIADKLLVNTTFIVMAFLMLLPWWFVAIVLLRDVLFLMAYGFSEIRGRRAEVAPIMVSKVNTGLQIILGSAVLVQAAYGWPLGYAVIALLAVIVVTSVFSAYGYFSRWLASFRNGAKLSQ